VGGQIRLLFATRYSLLAAVLPVANCQSPFTILYSPLAIRYSPFAAVFGSAGASPSHFVPSPVPRPTPPSVSVPCPIFNPNAQL